MASNEKFTPRIRRQMRVRKKVLGTDRRPRVCVFRSSKHIYAQVISDDRGVTIVSVSTLSKEFAGREAKPKGVEAAKQVGLMLAKACKDRNITQVVFDRNGFLYHGRVKALAEGARQGGLVF